MLFAHSSQSIRSGMKTVRFFFHCCWSHACFKLHCAHTYQPQADAQPSGTNKPKHTQTHLLRYLELSNGKRCSSWAHSGQQQPILTLRQPRRAFVRSFCIIIVTLAKQQLNYMSYCHSCGLMHGQSSDGIVCRTKQSVESRRIDRQKSASSPVEGLSSAHARSSSIEKWKKPRCRQSSVKPIRLAPKTDKNKIWEASHIAHRNDKQSRLIVTNLATPHVIRWQWRSLTVHTPEFFPFNFRFALEIVRALYVRCIGDDKE